MAEKTKQADVAKLSFEEALSELEDIVKTLEAGQGTLEQAIGAYERGTALKLHCQAKLKEAQEKVEKITLAPDGGVGTAPSGNRLTETRHAREEDTHVGGLQDQLRRSAKLIDDMLDTLLPRDDVPEARLFDAMRYSTLGGGKRLRPFLVVTSARAV